jgi:hypothetical protein
VASVSIRVEILHLGVASWLLDVVVVVVAVGRFRWRKPQQHQRRYLIEELHGQITELTQRLTTQDVNHHEVEDHEINLNSTFNNLFHNCHAVQGHRGLEIHQGDFGFKI